MKTFLTLLFFLTLYTGNAQMLNDTSQGYINVKPGVTEIISRIGGSENNNKLIFDSTGLSLFRNDSALIRFRDLPIKSNSSNSYLALDPITKEVYLHYGSGQALQLPPQQGNTGKYLKTDGQNLSWEFGQNIYASNFNHIYPDNDYAILQTAIGAAKDGDNIYLENRTYILRSGIFIQKSLNFIGQNNTVIKRADEIISPLVKAANSSSDKIIVANPSFFKEGDGIIVYKDSTWWGSTAIGYINKVGGDTLYLNSIIGPYNGTSINTEYAVGINVKKAYNLFSVASPDDIPTFTSRFSNIIFDGNRINNRSNLGYGHSWALGVLSKKVTNIDKCTFINMPTESIGGHNLKISNSLFKNLNGSAIHFSISKQAMNHSEIYSEISNNVFINTNQVSSVNVTSHSEGVFTTSNSGGYFTASHNRFTNCGEAIIGALYPSLGIMDYGTNNIIFTNNNIDTAKRLVYLIDTTTAGTISGVIINNNSINNFTDEIDMSASLKVSGRESILLQGFQSVSQSETLGVLSQSGASEGQTIKWNGSEWVAEDEKGIPAGANGSIQFNVNGTLSANSALHWNNSLEKLGVGVSDPQTVLHVKRSGELLRLETTTERNKGTGFISFYDPAGRKSFVGYGNTNNDNFSILNEQNSSLLIGTNSIANQLVITPSGNIGMGTHQPENSAILDLSSKTKGFLPPRLDSIEIANIANPAPGLLLFNNHLKRYEYFDGVQWQALSIVDRTSKIIHIPSTNYTLSAADAGKSIIFNNDSEITLNIPAGLLAGFNCTFIQKGNGKITIVPALQVEMLNRHGHNKTAGKFAQVQLIATNTDELIFSGDTAY